MTKKMKTLLQQWSGMTAKVKNREWIPNEELLAVYQETYCVAKECQKQKFVLKEVYQMMMRLDEFTFYANLWDDDYLVDIRWGVCELNYALKQLFFDGAYQSEFFLGATPQEVKPYTLNLATVSLQDFSAFLEKGTGEDYNQLELVWEVDEKTAEEEYGAKVMAHLKGEPIRKTSQQELSDIVDFWEHLTYTVLDKKEIPQRHLLGAIKESYRILGEFCKHSAVPKEVTKLFLEMESFLYFAYLMEEKELETDYYQFRMVNAMVTALKDGFFNGEYPADFPNLQLVDDDKNMILFDLEKDCLESLKG